MAMSDCVTLRPLRDGAGLKGIAFISSHVVLTGEGVRPFVTCGGMGGMVSSGDEGGQVVLVPGSGWGATG